jgi:hypothetical protein
MCIWRKVEIVEFLTDQTEAFPTFFMIFVMSKHSARTGEPALFDIPLSNPQPWSPRLKYLVRNVLLLLWNSCLHVHIMQSLSLIWIEKYVAVTPLRNVFTLYLLRTSNTHTWAVPHNAYSYYTQAYVNYTWEIIMAVNELLFSSIKVYWTKSGLLTSSIIYICTTLQWTWEGIYINLQSYRG